MAFGRERESALALDRLETEPARVLDHDLRKLRADPVAFEIEPYQSGIFAFVEISIRVQPQWRGDAIDHLIQGVIEKGRNPWLRAAACELRSDNHPLAKMALPPDRIGIVDLNHTRADVRFWQILLQNYFRDSSEQH